MLLTDMQTKQIPANIKEHFYVLNVEIQKEFNIKL